MNIQQIKQILDNAPESATHWDKLQYYRIRYADSSLKVAWDVFNQGSGNFNSVGDTYLTDVYKIQSLSDLRQILALHEENEKLKAALEAIKYADQSLCVCGEKMSEHPFSSHVAINQVQCILDNLELSND